ncbi:MAG: hypothetical protein BWY54_00762 [Candidatus Dependentiae bacterium ADurb.Bin331]|nr:MAG: hypothetical protein BWY54_00762 [Candidatus Dependentiae bacterium ADurb.Bin331]
MKKLILSLIFLIISSNIFAQQTSTNFKNLSLESLAKMQSDERKKMPDSQELKNLIDQKNKVIAQITAQMGTALEKTKNEIKEAWDSVKSQVNIKSRLNDQQIKNLKALAKSKAGNTITKLEEKLRVQQQDLAKLTADATKQFNDRIIELGKKIRIYEQENATLRAINKAIQDKLK